MTTPTQAQIEARGIVTEAARMLRYGGYKAEPKIADALIAEFDRMDALTAAAQVEEPRAPQTRWDIAWDKLIAERDNAVAATIKRCAQVVNKCLIEFQKQHDEDDKFSGIAVAALIADLVAAIRKLKHE